MQATLRRLHSPDAPDGLATFAPDDPERFSMLVQALVGPADSEGEESFDFTVSSPDLIAAEAADGKGFVFPRHRLVLTHWDPALVQRAIEDLVQRTEGKDWREIATKLSRFGRWEFEDYRPRR